MEAVPAILTAIALLLFLVAGATGVRLLRGGSPFSQPIVLYGTFLAFANAIYRSYTLYYRISPDPFPHLDYVVATALALQVGLATFLTISLLVWRTMRQRSG